MEAECRSSGLYRLPGSNAVDKAAAVRKLFEQEKQRFPDDVDYTIPVDTTRAVNEGIKEIVETLLIAIVLVVAVVYLFLQGWRATLIPLLAVPVSLVGTFVFFPLFGFTSIRFLCSAWCWPLAWWWTTPSWWWKRWSATSRTDLRRKQAAFKAMEEISGPVIGIALVLSAVFVPTAFIPGITGRLYQQFAVTIAISVILSAFNALSLSPALAALLLKPKTGEPRIAATVLRLVQPAFGRATDGYVRLSGALLRKSAFAWFCWPVSPSAGMCDRRQTAHQFRSGRGRGLLLPERPAPQRGFLQRTEEVVAKVQKIVAGLRASRA